MEAVRNYLLFLSMDLFGRKYSANVTVQSEMAATTARKLIFRLFKFASHVKSFGILNNVRYYTFSGKHSLPEREIS